jgi:hypothetical protein
MKFKNVPVQVDAVHLAVHKPLISTHSNVDEQTLPTWKCSIDIPTNNIQQVCQRIAHERYLWDQHFAESRIVEKIDDDKEIVQYVLNFLDSVPVRSFCEFQYETQHLSCRTVFAYGSFDRFMKTIVSHSIPTNDAILISAISIDHLQNHFLPGSIGLTYQMHYYITSSHTHSGYTTVTQMACVDFRCVDHVLFRTRFINN